MIAFRQCDQRLPFFWEDAGQPAGRWQGDGDGPVQYLADTPAGAWAEFLRHEEITDAADLPGISRAPWAIDIDRTVAGRGAPTGPPPLTPMPGPLTQLQGLTVRDRLPSLNPKRALACSSWNGRAAHMVVVTLDPRSVAPESDALGPLAPRPESLRGHTLGIIANGLGESETFLDRLGATLQDRYGLAGVVTVVKPGLAVPPYPEQWEAIIDRATVAITGFGGCGSCSTRSMRDALELETLGIPAVCVAHEALLPAVTAIAQYVGAADYPPVTLGYPHNPGAHWTDEESTELAQRLADDVQKRLVR